MKRNQVNRHPKLPAGFGSIRYLGGGRRNPYAVYPTSRGQGGKASGAICYVSDWFIGVAVLAAWNAGEYEPGLPVRFSRSFASCAVDEKSREKLDDFCQEMLNCFRTFIPSGSCSCTLREAFEHFFAWKYDESAPRRLSETSASHDRWAFQHFSALADLRMDGISTDELQAAVNRIGLKRSAVDRAVTLIKGIYRHALSRELCTRNPAQYVRTPAVLPSVSHQDFTDEELRVLWSHRMDPMIRMILIMCYSGFRWSAYLTMETNLEEGYFRGGVKSEAGRNRTVPIHSGIRPLVEAVLRDEGQYHCGMNQYKFIREMKKKLKEIGVDRDGRHHTPHSCRHTFSRLCESYGVREADRKRMMGHSFGKDITNGVYGHRSLEELRSELEKIKVPQAYGNQGTFL